MLLRVLLVHGRHHQQLERDGHLESEAISALSKLILYIVGMALDFSGPRIFEADVFHHSLYVHGRAISTVECAQLQKKELFLCTKALTSPLLNSHTKHDQQCRRSFPSCSNLNAVNNGWNEMRILDLRLTFIQFWVPKVPLLAAPMNLTGP